MTDINLFKIIAEKSMTFTDYDIEIKSFGNYFINGKIILLLNNQKSMKKILFEKRRWDRR
jgi:hypothetical protein